MMIEKPIEEMSREELEVYLAPKRRRYKPGMHLRRGETFKPTGFVYKDFFTELEESTVPAEEIEEKYIRKLLARGGYTRETAKKALARRFLEYMEKEGGS